MFRVFIAPRFSGVLGTASGTVFRRHYSSNQTTVLNVAMPGGARQSRLWMVVAGGASLAGVFATSYLWKQNAVNAKSPEIAEPDLIDAGKKVGEKISVDDETEAAKKKRPGFRDRRVIEYENRIRSYSTPDKIFRYFATLKMTDSHGDTTIYMTPADFVRSITPDSKQPDGLGLDQFRKFDPKLYKLKQITNDDSIFNRLGENGLITFADYIFLLTVLSTPKRNFEIAFRMFDINGDGDVSFHEFEQVQSIVRSQTSAGQRHRDHNVTGSVMHHEVGSALSKYFFGQDRSEKLTVKRFLEFQRRVQDDTLKLEFNHYSGGGGSISEWDFAELLLLYAGHSKNKRVNTIKRVKKRYKGSGGQGIKWQSYHDFWQVVKVINDVDTALTFWHMAGAAIDPMTLKHVAKTCAKVNLNDHITEVIFSVFDENNDGRLSHREFVTVLRQRMARGLEKSRDTGVTRLLSAMFKCLEKTEFVRKSTAK